MKTRSCLVHRQFAEGCVGDLDDNGGVEVDFLAHAKEDEGVAIVETVSHQCQ